MGSRAAAWLTSLCALVRGYPEVMLAVACFVVLRVLLNRNSSSGLPMSWPVIGMLPYVATHNHRLHDWITDILRLSGHTFRFQGPWFAGGEVVMTCDPANVNHVFNANFANYPKGDDYADIFDILGDGIFNADDESWRSQRRMAHALMSHASFRAFVARASRDKVRRALLPLLRDVAERGPDQVVDLQEVFTRFTFDSTCNIVFGVDPGCLSPDFPAVPFARAIDVVEEVILIRHIMPKMWWQILRWLRLGSERRFAAAWDTIDSSVADFISRRREERSTALGSSGPDQRGADLLTSYLENQAETHKCDAEFDKFLRDTTLSLMIAGRDTTSSALTWFFWLVSTNPDVEAKILEELRANLPATGGTGTDEVDGLVVFDTEEICKMVYLHAALCESLRLYPPVPFEHKSPVKSEVLPSGITVYECTRVVFSLYAMGRMEGIWGKDCGEFRPERWISEKGRVKHEPSYKFLSFNAGPRTCLGKDMAFTQMKAVAAAMIYNFHVDVDPAHRVAPKLSIILHMENGLKVRVNRRRAAAAMIG